MARRRPGSGCPARTGSSAYLADVQEQGERALAQYGMLVVPGAEITQNQLRSRKNAHIIGLDLKEYVSADQRADEILRAIRRQGGLSIACHPHHRPTRRIEISTCYLWDHREKLADFHKPKHLYSWKTLVRAEKNWPAVSRALKANVDIALTLFRDTVNAA